LTKKTKAKVDKVTRTKVASKLEGVDAKKSNVQAEDKSDQLSTGVSRVVGQDTCLSSVEPVLQLSSDF